jgi:predicted dehydrogenase
MTEKLKIGIIGCGGVSKNHIDSFLGYEWRRDPKDGKFKFLLKTKVPDNEVAAICDLDKQKATDTYEHYREKGYEIKDVFYGEKSYQELLKLDLDAVSICVPPINDKIEIIRDCLKKDNLHLLVEKPLSFDYNSAKTIYDDLKTVHTSNRVTAMCYNWRNTYIMNKLRELITTGKYGDLLSIEIVHVEKWNYTDPNSFYTKLGYLFEHNVHDINYLRFVNGEISEIINVNAYGNIPENPSSFTVDFNYSNGVRGLYHSMNGAGEGRDALKIQAVFKKGLVLGFLSKRNPDFELQNEDYFRIIGPDGEIFSEYVSFQSAQRLNHVHIIDDFLRSIKNGDEPKSNIKDGFRDIAVMDAIRRSMMQRMPVKIDMSLY